MYIIIGGCGLVGLGLIQQLVNNKHEVVVIDRDRSQCEKIYAEYGVVSICANANDYDALKEAGAERADAIVGLLRNDAENLAVALLAKSFKVKNIVVRMRDPQYEEAFIMAGVTSYVRMVDMFVKNLMLEIEQPPVRNVYTLSEGAANLLTISLPQNSIFDNQTISDIANHPDYPSECLITGVYRLKANHFSIPRGYTKVQATDQLFVIAKPNQITKVTKVLALQGK